MFSLHIYGNYPTFKQPSDVTLTDVNDYLVLTTADDDIPYWIWIFLRESEVTKDDFFEN